MALVDPIAIERQTMQDIVDAVRIRTARGSGGSGGALPILVTAPVGSTVTAEKDGKTYTGVWSESENAYIVDVDGYGTYIVSGTNNEYTVSRSVRVYAATVMLSGNQVPIGYAQLAYIESTGTQYISTSIIEDSTNIQTTVDYSTEKFISNNIIIGTSRGSGYYHFTIYNNKYYWGLNGGEDYGGSYAEGRHQVIYNGSNSAVLLDGVLLGSGKEINLPNAELLLLRRGGDYSGTARIYYAEVYNKKEEVTLAKFYPAMRIQDGEIGLYDTVRNQFYTNAGTGKFIAGPEVE